MLQCNISYQAHMEILHMLKGKTPRARGLTGVILPIDGGWTER